MKIISIAILKKNLSFNILFLDEILSLNLWFVKSSPYAVTQWKLGRELHSANSRKHLSSRIEEGKKIAQVMAPKTETKQAQIQHD